MSDTKAKELIGVSQAARILRLSESRVRQLAAQGTLSAQRMNSGLRIFDAVDVARVAAERARATGGEEG
jgi:DNA-binding transcriptional MerR regulator